MDMADYLKRVFSAQAGANHGNSAKVISRIRRYLTERPCGAVDRLV
jgi:hypothetical protein